MKKYPILITLPHCSYFVPVELRKQMLLSNFEVKKQCDLFTDEIFAVPKAHIIKSKISRLVADPNRAPDDIELECQLCNDGVVISITEDGKTIYRTPPKVEEIFERVKKYHDTFHKEIDKLTPKVKFLIDGHSLWNKGPITKADAGKKRADIVLGNRDYTTCSRATTLKIAKFFEKHGFSVKINTPYKGKYVIGQHCSKKTLPGIQIEINRKLYMNEKTLHPNKENIKKLKKIITALVEYLLFITK